MHFGFRILGSSSKGNSALLTTEHSKVLIDAGFSARKLSQKLAEAGESIDDIDAVFLTHEHSDHCAGIRGLCKNQKVQFFANRETAREIDRKLTHKPKWKFFETGSCFHFKDLEIISFALPHDAADPVGFLVRTGDGTLFSPYRSVAWVTDLGHVPKLIHERIREADILVLESNYDPEMLDASQRAWSLKQRIKSRHGHLSNEAAITFLKEVDRPRWTRVFLAHLSDECNSVDCVRQTFGRLLSQTPKFQLDIIEPINGLGPACT